MIKLPFLSCLVLTSFILPAISNSDRNLITDLTLKDVSSTLLINGHQNLDFVSLDYQDTNTYLTMTRLSLSLTGDYKVVRKNKSPPQKCYFEECYYIHLFYNIPTSPVLYLSNNDINYSKEKTLVFLVSTVNSEHIRYYLKETAQRDLLSTVMIMTKALTAKEMYKIQSLFDELGKNSMFFWLYKLKYHNKIIWKRVITLKGYDNAIINDVQINNQSRIKEEYDLQGLHLTSMSLPWFPYFHLYDCDELGMGCKSAGYLKTFMDNLGTLMNFTWESHKEINDNWGLVRQADGIWDGVVGHIFNGSYQLSIR